MKNRHPIFVLTVVALIALCFSATSAAAPNTTGQWDSLGLLPVYSVHSMMLPTGKAMVWPGDQGISGNDPTAWDPSPPPNGSLTSLTKSGYDLFCSGHSFLADGGLFVTGGHNGQNYYGLKQASIYNPFTNTWNSSFPDMNAGRWYPTNTTLANGDVLVVSGVDDGTIGLNPLPQVFQVSTGTWRNLTGAELEMPLYPAMLLAPNGKVFYAGPDYVTRYLDTAGSGSWIPVADRGIRTVRDYGSAVMYAPGKVLVMGGGNPSTNTAEVIDLNVATPTWRTVAPMQYSRRQLNALLLPDGQVLVTGGFSGAGFDNLCNTNPNPCVYPAELWNPDTETWSTMAASNSIPRVYHSSTVLLPDGRAWSTGGNNQTQIEVYSPPYLFKGTRPTITSMPSSFNYGQSIFVQTPDAASITRVRIIRTSATTHSFNQSQVINQLSFSQTAGGINVIAPPNGNVAPPGYYMLFILNGNGVPSVASMVKLTQQSQTVTAPTVATVSASSVGATGATLNGSANPNGGATTGWFRYSTANPGACNDTFGTRFPSTGGSSLGSGTTAVPFSQALTGLSASTPYYFCAIGSNSVGPAFGSVLSFTTTTASTGGSLSGSGTSSVTAANLTTEGSGDWIHWGDASLNRKSGGTAQLSSYTLIGGGTVFSYDDDPRPLSWSNGAPTLTSTNNKNGVYIDGVGNGFSFTAPADTSTRTLTVHVGGWKSGGRLVAHLSDSSAADYVDVTAAATGQYDRNYVISYTAASAGQTLTVSWTMNSGAGNVTLNGAALTSSTGGGTVTAPTVATVAASSVGATGATLNGSANPNGGATTGWFRYSTANPGACNDTFGTRFPSTGGSSLGSGAAAASYSQALTGLSASTPYYFCAIGSNSVGTSFGSVLSFNTSAASTGGGELSGSGTSSVTAANLTTEGSGDWIHWGDASLNRKSGVAAQLSNYTPIGGGTVFSYDDDLRPLSWTDGNPTVTSTNNKNGVYVDGAGNGFSFTVPAVTSTRTLMVHVGGWNSGGTLVAHLSDDSAADFVDVTPTVAGQYDRNYVLSYKASYKAASGDYTLTVKWTMNSGAGNVTLNGAALTFSTGGGTVTAPTVATVAASSVGATGATLNGSANPNGGATTGWFRYSTTNPGACNDTFGTRFPSTGGSSLGSGAAAASYSQALTGLSASTPYYFCAIGSNSVGTSFGSVLSFTTTAASTGGSLSGSGTSSVTAANLTTEGSGDWIHWGDASLNRKSGGTAQLSSYTLIGGGTVFSYDDDPRPLSWSNGAPTLTSTNNKNGVYVDGAGNGFSFTAPADTSTRTLTVHVGGWNSGGTLLAHLSDNSAADYVDVTAAATGQYDRNYVISYTAASAGQTLTVSWTMSSGFGNVTFNSAALQ